MRRALVLIAGLAGACGGASPRPEPPLPHAAYAHYLDGKLAAYREDWPAAVEALADAAAAAPDQPMIAVELARAQHRAKRLADARATLATARTKWPKHPQVWLASGDVLAAADERGSTRAEAIAAYRRAIELAPLDERGYLGLAKLQEPAAALATLERLVDRVPGSTDGRYRLAVRLAKERRLEPAIAELRRVLELDPDHIDARLDLARGLRLTGKLDEAIAQTRSAFDRSGQALDIAEELYYLLLEADDRVGALDLLTLLDDDRSDPDALAAVARLHRGLGRVDEARAIAARLAKLDADLGALALADVELATGDAKAAARRALAIAEGSERFVQARRFAAAALLAARAPQQALDVLAPARAAHPDDVELATVAAFALVDLGRRDEATALAATLGDGPAATFARARVADHAGDTRAALALVEGLLRTRPDHAAALNFAGFLLAEAGQRLADAERYLRRARELQPGDPAILDSWGWLLHKRGDHRAAVTVLDKAARYAPLEPEILVHLAAAWLAHGDRAVAERLLDRAAALHPSAAVEARITGLRAAIARPR